MKIKTFLTSAIAGFTAFAMAFTMLPTGSLDNVTAAGDNMVLHWDMTKNDDGTLKDLTGNNHNGKIQGTAAASNIGGIDVLDMTGGYVEIPNGTIGTDTTEVTINMLVNISKNVKSSWMFCLGTDSTKYLYLTACSNQDEKMRGGIGQGSPGYNHEAVIKGENALTPEVWQNITVTYKDNGKFTFYQNGEKKGEGDAVTDKTGDYTLQDLMTATDNKDGYMCWSFYEANDPKFQGKVADFRIYDKEMTAAEVADMYGDINETLENLAANEFKVEDITLTEADCLGTNTSKDAITDNLVLPATTNINGDAAKPATVTWESANPAVIANDGTVTRAMKDQTVTMTAIVNRNGFIVRKPLTFTVANEVTDENAIQTDAAAVTIPNQDDIRGNIYLADEGEFGSKIAWTSSDENIISPKASESIAAGKVNRPTDRDAKVTLTATITYGTLKETKTFECTVKKAPKMAETTDYLFAYFPYTNVKDERIYFGTSEDGLNFSALNNGEFVIESKLGTHGLRDPFIIRSHEGDRFYLIATDLTVAGLEQDGTKYPGQSWDGPSGNQQSGSQYIMVWESTDLVNWSKQRMCHVAKDNAGCTWAPEAYWVDEIEAYAVFWASKTGDDNYKNQRLYYATTRDFYHFSEPQVWIDEAGSVIDTTVIKVDDYYYRYTKNEAGNNNKYGTPSKRVYCERSTSLLSTESKTPGDTEDTDPTKWELVHKNSLDTGDTKQIEGPCILKLNSDDVENAKYIAGLKGFELTGDDIYCLLADKTGVTIFPGLSDDITKGDFYILGQTKGATAKDEDGNTVPLYSMPEPDASHGTIMPITSEEYNNLKLKWDTEYRKKAKELTDSAAEQITLPTAKVTSDLTLPTSIGSDITITWDSSDESIVAPDGKITRPAYEQGDATVKLTATIAVKSNDKTIRDQIVKKSFDITVEKLAQAEPDKYTVTFDSDKGSAVSSQSIISGEKATAPKNPTRKNYTFAGWYNGNTKYDFNTPVTANLSLKAKWTKVSVKAPSKAPTLKNKKSKQLTITIKKVSGAAGYQVTYSTDKKFKKKATKTKLITKNTVTINKLKKGKTYYVKVKAYKKDSTGAKVYSSKFSKTAKIKIKK